MSQKLPIILSLHKKPQLLVMAQINIEDTPSGTAGINLFGFQVPTWLILIVIVGIIGVVF